jgi:hypothetical protein
MEGTDREGKRKEGMGGRIAFSRAVRLDFQQPGIDFPAAVLH